MPRVASYNNHWGVPLTLARMPKDTEYAVIEIGMNHPGEIAPLAKRMAEREGFEPSVQLPTHTLSKRAPSATQTPLQSRPSEGKDPVPTERTPRE